VKGAADLVVGVADIDAPVRGLRLQLTLSERRRVSWRSSSPGTRALPPPA
jgi:hypothetical protein